MTRTVLLVAFVVLLCASCSTAVRGTPTPNFVPSLPPRPRELRIDGIDPCATLTKEQVTSLGVEYAGRSKPLDNHGPGCNWSHVETEPLQAYTVDINTQGGVELAFGQPRLSVLTVAGFGAVATPALFSTGEDNCVINIDVAPRQAVQVAYFYIGHTVRTNHEIVCGNAQKAAELAMQNIIGKLGR